MSFNSALNDEQWLQLLEEVARAYNEVTLSRGYSYFKQQFVTSLSISEDRVIQAKVTGSENYKVTLHLNKFRSSSCSCPVHTSCKHLAAVMMELADRMGYPASQIVNAKGHLQRTHSIAASKSVVKELPGMDVFSWHSFLDSFTSPIKPSYDRAIYTEALRSQVHSIQKDNVPFSAMDWVYFELHQELFILRKIKEQSVQGGTSYFTSSLLYRMYDEIHAWLQHKSALFNFTLAGERLQQTLGYMRQQMAEEKGHKYLEYGLYTTIWRYWIAPDPEANRWAEQEINDINKQTTESTSASLYAAKALLYLHQSKSSEAWAALEDSGMLKEAPASLFLPFLSHISVSQDWASLLDWLMKTSSYFYGQRVKEIDAYMGYWKEAVAHLPEAEKHLWEVLEGMLPHSTQIIEDVLYEQQKWKAWVEMQILQGHDPLYHRVSVIQPIEKAAPDLLLPYYHQSIEHYVALKNRRDYKLAVKLLKRLKKVYLKMKQIQRWERFLTHFTDRHSRLRALQEEMKKGKLLE
ncbi:hypothetical protein D3C73_671260 [compost metagenome]